MPANSSFTSISSAAPQACTESGRFAVGSTRRRSAKAPVSSTRLASQTADVLSKLPEDESIIRAVRRQGEQDREQMKDLFID